MPHLKRAVNDPLIQSSGYKAYSYVNPMAREQDPGKTLDLNSLDFSLDDFQKLTKGHYNAGELRLTDSGKLDIVNHHKTWSLFNHKTIDGADSFAIRVAFAKAMEAGGVGKQEMRNLRKALGLNSDYSMRSTEALQPLTRQVVRQIIDKNIAVLNANRAPGDKLKTYDQLHARYSEKENKDIRETRETINRTGTAPNFAINPELKNLLTVVKKNPTFEGLSVEDAEDCLEFIDELTGAIECLRDDGSRFNWMRENHTEYKVPVSGGALGMAIALEGGNLAVETVSNGKLSRISLGVTPAKILERLENARGLLNQIVDRDDDETAKPGKDASGDTALADAVPGKSKARKPEQGNIYNINQPDADPGKSGLRDAGNIFSEIPQIKAGRPNSRRPDASRKAPEIKEEPPSESAESKAKKNFNTLVTLIAKQYDLEPDVVGDIIKEIDDWEYELSQCSTSGHPTELADINDNLRDFLLNNHATIQPLLDQAIRDKDA